MKIGVTTFGCDGGKSGISRYVIELLRQFGAMDTGDTLEVVVTDDEREVFDPGSAHVTMLPLSPGLRETRRNLLWHQKALPRMARDRGWDVLFLPAGNRRLPYASPVPTVGTVHDFSSLHVPGKYDRTHTLYIRRVLPFLCRRLTHIVAVSESGKSDIVRHARVSAERVTVIPHAADPLVYHTGNRQGALERVQARRGFGGRYILYTARIEHPGKNHTALIRAYAALRAAGGLSDCRLVLAGKDWDGAAAVHAEADASGFGEDILFPGFVSDAELPDLYAGADLFVFPSLFEGFGLPILEAMASGTPVACANRSSLPEVAGDAAMLFDPGDPAELARIIDRVLGSAEERRTWAARGVARSAEFSWRSTAERTLSVLHSAAAQPCMPLEREPAPA